MPTYNFSSGQILTAVDLNNKFAQTATTAANASTITDGTLDAARLPYVMDQNVATSSDVQFRDGIFTGNLTVSGTTTYVNTATLDIKDINITIAKGAANSAAANGAGITIDGANVNFKYDDSTNTMILDRLLSIGNSTVNAVFGYNSSQLSGGQFIGNVNNYFQIIATNANTGTSASGDYVVADDTGINSTNYIDMGINSSLWSNTQWTISGPSDSYLYASGGNLAIGTASRKATVFFANGTLATNEVMQIDSGANVNIGNVKSGATSLTIGNTTVNTVITSTAVQIGNNVSNTSGMYPASNSIGTALGSSTKRWIINANTIDTISVNAVTSVNSALLSVGTSFIANTTGVYHTGLANALSFNVGTSTIANATGVYTGTVNAASHTVGSTFTANATLVNAAAINITGQVNTATLYAATSANIASAVQANSTGLWSTGTVNGAVISQGTNFVANSIGAYHVGTINAASHTVGATFTANATLVNAAAINISNQVNTATLYAVTSANVGANVQMTTSAFFVGNSTVNTSITAAVVNVNGAFIANNTGAYHTGVVNALTIQASATFTANSTLVNAAAINITGQVNTATLYAATSANIASAVQANATGVYTTGTVNAASYTVGATFTANATLVNAAAINIVGQTNTSTFFATTSANVGANVQSNTSALFIGNSTVNSIFSAGAVQINSGTLSSGNTTVTGFVNATSSVNSALLTVGATFTANATLVNAAAINITNQVNTTTLYAVTSANIASAVQANATGVWTTGTVNASIISQGTNFVANSTGAFHTGQVNAASLTTNNFTANSTTATHATQLSSPSHITGDGLYVANNSTIFVGNNSTSRVLTNTSVITVGNTSVNAYINSTSFSGIALTANNASYLGGLAAASFVSASANVNFTGANIYFGNSSTTSNVYFQNTSVIYANNRFGTVNQILTSNGTAMYWADASGVGTNTLFAFAWTNSHTWGNTTQQANITMSNGYFLASTINATSITTTNITINTTAISAGANVYANTTTVFVGNSTVNTNITAGSLSVNGAVIANTLGVYVGANAYTTSTTHFVGNSTVNAYMNSTTMAISGNGTHNTVITANQITLDGSNVVTTATALKVYYANNVQAFP